ncbi:MAG TPA: SigB/SigF/SigG family RNA polymerase sigma factor [Acidimicrobiia bacterium]|nr:SigB/SigF/SigG family RNA polymerase sigma factor [Acidimicrobiia bacterium]
MPEPDQDQEALELFSRRADADARRRIVEIYDPLAQRLASRFRGRSVDRDDLIQVARFGLINAINRFDPDRGVKFTTYAGRTIIGELKHHFRDHAWSLRVPRSLQNLWLEVSRAVDPLTQSLGRVPTITEISEYLAVPAEDVLEALDAGSAFSVGSLDQPVGDEGGSVVGDLIGSLDAALDLADERSSIAEHLRALPDRERTILYLRFYEGRTQSEIAQEIGVSQVHVSRLVSKVIEQLRDAIRGDPGQVDAEGFRTSHSGEVV